MDPMKLDTKTCYIFRGPPGSGKTTVAERLTKTLPGLVYISMDRYRTDEKGNYHFDPSKVAEDVKRMKEEFYQAVFRGELNVVLDNVHSRYWEYGWAAKQAYDFGYIVHVVEVQADLMTCFHRQRHPVPWDKLVEIFERWETTVRMPDIKDILGIMTKIINRAGISGNM